ncbi:MFS transporter [Cohaesibacter haloalkalitolerans]|uniref:MFS transporter n=1 Tax=Cohaesibacter haloalkalitolerans TaxID=1162980 RepID=UPI000E65BCB1|nr:MFS transporter [Cohaesibacter haloalkalitolerans]
MSNLCDASCQSTGQTGRLTAIIHSLSLIAFFAASSAPTPLYRLYQHNWAFSSDVLTLIFGVYPIALLVALLFAGKLSDFIGRRPVIALALGIEIVAMTIFLFAQSPYWLLGARVMQGVATGLATAALGAALLDLDQQLGGFINSVAPMSGMALGALGTAALVQLAPAPLHLVYIVLLAAFLAQTVFTWMVPETRAPRPGAIASLRARIAIPNAARVELLAVTPINVALWAMGGFYLSLMPTLISQAIGDSSVWLGGISVAALTLSGAAFIVMLSNAKPRTALIGGAYSLLAGLVVTLIGINASMTSLLIVGSMIAGGGFGLGFLGAMRSVMPLAKADERAGLMSAFYLQSYLANSVPTILAGFLTRNLDLTVVADVYVLGLIVMVTIGLGLTLRRKQTSTS